MQQNRDWQSFPPTSPITSTQLYWPNYHIRMIHKNRHFHVVEINARVQVIVLILYYKEL